MIAHARRGTVDLRMGVVLVVGGLVGSAFGVWLFAVLRQVGQIDLVISLSYVVFLGTVGGLMLVEAWAPGCAAAAPRRTFTKRHQHLWLHGLPLKMRFHRSRLYISALIAAGARLLRRHPGAIMGVGGGFLMVPAMIYLLGMPTSGGGRHVAVPDRLRDRRSPPSCRPSTTRRSTSCWRCP